jgi:hypothetical protein
MVRRSDPPLPACHEWSRICVLDEMCMVSYRVIGARSRSRGPGSTTSAGHTDSAVCSLSSTSPVDGSRRGIDRDALEQALVVDSGGPPMPTRTSRWTWKQPFQTDRRGMRAWQFATGMPGGAATGSRLLYQRALGGCIAGSRHPYRTQTRYANPQRGRCWPLRPDAVAVDA